MPGVVRMPDVDSGGHPNNSGSNNLAMIIVKITAPAFEAKNMLVW